MNFAVTEDEAAVMAAAGDLAADDDPWAALVKGGWLDLVLDDPAAGLAYTGLVAEALGAAGVSVPFVGGAVVWPTLFGTSAAGRRVAVAEDGLAEDGAGAEVLVVLEAASASAYDAFTAQRVAGLEGDGLSTAAPTGTPIARCDGAELVAQARRRAAAVAAAEMAGAIDSVAGMTRAYVAEREQFGRPIASFQAVAHGTAHLATLAEAARWAARLACRSTEPADTHAAKGWISAASAEAAALAHQLHGAVGFTEEYGLGRLTKRLRVLRFAWGDDRRHHEALGRLVTG